MLKKKTLFKNLFLVLLLLILLSPIGVFAQPSTSTATVDSTARQYAEKMLFDGSNLLKQFIQFAGITVMLFGLATIGMSYRNSQGEDSMTTQGVLMIAIGGVMFSASFVETGNDSFINTMLTLTKVAFFAGGGLLAIMGLGNIGLSIQTSQATGVSKGVIQMIGGIIIAVSGVLFTGIKTNVTSSTPVGT